MSTEPFVAEPRAELSVRVVKKVAPCGCCRNETPRDDMWAVNLKVFDPKDGQEHVQIRLCEPCAQKEVARARAMQWDNSEMRIVS